MIDLQLELKVKEHTERSREMNKYCCSDTYCEKSGESRTQCTGHQCTTIYSHLLFLKSSMGALNLHRIDMENDSNCNP